MQLVQQDPDSRFTVRCCAPGRIVVGDRTLTASFLLAPDRLVEGWPVRDLSSLDAAAIEAVLALAPDVVLLGTGERHRFPPPATMAAFLTRGIGIEPMSNAAAARTYNVLAGEGRQVVAAFILGAD